jgi:hypothetical protein
MPCASLHRVGVELRLVFHVLLRVGYDPEIVSDSRRTVDLRCAGCTAGVDVKIGAPSTFGRRSPLQSAMNSHEPKTKVAPSSCLVTMEAPKDAITLFVDLFDEKRPHGRRQVSMKYTKRVSRDCLEDEVGDDVAEYLDVKVTRDDLDRFGSQDEKALRPVCCILYCEYILSMRGPCLPLYSPGSKVTRGPYWSRILILGISLTS